jgi:DNA-binding MarR family transcriptional regulator
MTDCPSDPDSRFGSLVSILNRAAQIYFARALAPYAIGPGQQAYLLVVSPGESVSQLTIAERLSMDKANVARAVKALETVGYLERSRPEEDRRRWNVRLTREGELVRERVQAHMREWVSAIRSAVTPDDWQSFVTILSRVAFQAREHALGVAANPR